MFRLLRAHKTAIQLCKAERRRRWIGHFRFGSPRSGWNLRWSHCIQDSNYPRWNQIYQGSYDREYTNDAGCRRTTRCPFGASWEWRRWSDQASFFESCSTYLVEERTLVDHSGLNRAGSFSVSPLLLFLPSSHSLEFQVLLFTFVFMGCGVDFSRCDGSADTWSVLLRVSESKSHFYKM